MKRFILINYMVLFIFFALSAQTQNNEIIVAKGQWEILPDKSELDFKIRNLWLSNVEGSILITTGIITVEEEILMSGVTVEIDPSTIATGNDKRDEHLRSRDFFYVDEYPSITFLSTGFSPSKRKEFEYSTRGTLTLRGVSHEVPVFFNFNGIKNQGDRKMILINGEATVNRFDFNIDWKGMGVGEEATVTFNVMATEIKKTVK